jgi:NADPH-dependent ferric siderophore reductase
MADDDVKARLLAVRKPPPPLEPVTVMSRDEVSPRLLRLRLEGEVLRRLEVPQVAMSVRFVVPWPDEDELIIPEWEGNEFLRADGSRPALRTFTPLDHDPDAGQLTLEVVRHDGGAVSAWAEQAGPGATAALSGCSAGYDIPDGATRLLALGDETAIPAIRQIIDAVPAGLQLDAHVEVVVAEARLDLPVTWHVTPEGHTPGGELAAVVEALSELADGTYVWAAGEASAMQRIRNHVYKTLGADRDRAAVRGYWKPERDHAPR